MTHPAPDRLFVDFQSAIAGRYSLERELARGGMGVVYLAREVRLDRPVAIKLLPPSKASDPKLRERFLREARTAAKLSHPNIIPIHAVEEIGEFVFFAMAYIEGETLTERVRRRGPLAPSDGSRLLRDVAWALAYAHTQGVIHRDVKPDNILLENTGRVLVADFGIAGVVAGAAGLNTGEIIGTPEFMSPEQALGEAVDPRSDLYSLGLVGYFALSGTLPFEAEKATEVLAKQVTEPVPPLASVAPLVPRRLSQAIDRCLAKAPEERPDGPAVLAEQLSHALEQRRELPVALRAFVKHDARLDGSGVLLYPFAMLLATPLVGFWTGSVAMGFATLVAGYTLVPLGVLINRARRLLNAGFGHPDIGVAFKAEIERSREERAYGLGHGGGPSLIERILRWISVPSLATAAITLPIMVTTGSDVGLFLTAQLFGWSLLAGVGSGVGALIMLQRRRDVDAEFWGRLWTGRLGRWLFGFARLFTSRKALPASLTHRPTELALGMAAEQLYDSLPKETRNQLRDLPDVVHRLERDAQTMRTRLDELQEALADVPQRGASDPTIAARHDRIVSDLTAERDLVQQRLQDAVAALETIRLNLLRLHAGTGTVHSLTTDLGLARELARDIGVQVDAYRVVEQELSR
ncbi:MAG TPA: serine/threonine-protein kinase [Gemmatimonadales bacterium]|nr:serine/threonine-protein kinase [Gemmatimonadales bacterium]